MGCAAGRLQEKGRGWPGDPEKDKGQEAGSGDLSWGQWGPGEVDGGWGLEGGAGTRETGRRSGPGGGRSTQRHWDRGQGIR